VSDEHYGASPRPADVDLRALTAVSVLKRGIAVAGLVIDVKASRLAGASVAQGRIDLEVISPRSKPMPKASSVSATAPRPAGADGQPSNTRELKEVTVVKDMPELEFKLSPAKTVPAGRG